MEPFSVSASGMLLRSTFLDPAALQRFWSTGPSDRELTNLIRIWVSEGIPFAFAECPLLYEEVRRLIASEVKIHAKEVTMVGSGRLGFTIKPAPDFGQRFDNSSDLDFTIVSQELFQRCAADADKFVTRFKAGECKPFSALKQQEWAEDTEYLERNTPKGFVNHGKIPSTEQYPTACLLENLFWKVSEKLRKTHFAPVCRKASWRVYRDWHAFTDRTLLNFIECANRW